MAPAAPGHRDIRGAGGGSDAPRPLDYYSNKRIYASMNINPDDMAAAAGQASDLLKAIGHPYRLMLLCQMIDRERSVGELAAALGIRESTTSQHLALLRKDGLIRPRREAQTIRYSIASIPAQRIMAVLFDLYCAPSPSGGAGQATAQPPAGTR
mgnify:CR=1 FL=1